MTQLYTDYGNAASAELPEHYARIEPTPQRVRVMLNGVAIADSRNVLIMHESQHQPAYYFPFHDVRMDLMTPTDTSTT
jgi:uncharacterized protein (DUF427 family)